jgi:hypothetical protein
LFRLICCGDPRDDVSRGNNGKASTRGAASAMMSGATCGAEPAPENPTLNDNFD